jgi:uncharacterized protein (TIGR03085 family)
MSSPAGVERQALCDLFDELGPDEPTLCGEWTTRDLAAHLVVRERRPDAAIGLFTPFLASYTERVRREEAARPFPTIVERVREGPPVWSPARLDAIDRAGNSVEFFVHHEDVRRAQGDWTMRSLDPELDAALTATIARLGRLLARKLRVGLVLAPDGQPELRVRRADPVVTITGPIGECVLYLYGRKDVARVDLSGPDDAVAQVAGASFGI